VTSGQSSECCLDGPLRKKICRVKRKEEREKRREELGHPEGHRTLFTKKRLLVDLWGDLIQTEKKYGGKNNVRKSRTNLLLSRRPP